MRTQSDTPMGKAFNLEKPLEYTDGSVVSKTLIDRKAGNVTLFAFDQGQGLSEHTAPFEAMVYILDGKARIPVGGDPHTVAAGQMLILPANITHAPYGDVPFKMLLVMIRET